MAEEESGTTGQQWSEETLMEAIRRIDANEIPLHEVENLYGIPIRVVIRRKTRDTIRAQLNPEKPVRTDLTNRRPAADISILSQPLEISSSGISGLVKLLTTGTDEIKNLLTNECSIILECCVCKALFRSIVNFMIHKRQNCTSNYNDGYNESDTNDDNSHENVEDRSSELRPQQLLRLNRFIRDQVNRPTRRTCKADLLSIIKKMEFRSSTTYEPILQLEPINSTCAAFTQSLIPSVSFKPQFQIPSSITDSIVENTVINSDGTTNNQDGTKEDASSLSEHSASSLTATTDVTAAKMNTRYGCPCCNSILSLKKTAVRHLRTVHGKSLDEIEMLKPKIKTIEVTGAMESSDTVTEHCGIINDGIRPTCHFCDKTFSHKKSLKAHLKLYCPRKKEFENGTNSYQQQLFCGNNFSNNFDGVVEFENNTATGSNIAATNADGSNTVDNSVEANATSANNSSASKNLSLIPVISVPVLTNFRPYREERELTAENKIGIQIRMDYNKSDKTNQLQSICTVVRRSSADSKDDSKDNINTEDGTITKTHNDRVYNIHCRSVTSEKIKDNNDHKADKYPAAAAKEIFVVSNSKESSNDDVIPEVMERNAVHNSNSVDDEKIRINFVKNRKGRSASSSNSPSTTAKNNKISAGFKAINGLENDSTDNLHNSNNKKRKRESCSSGEDISKKINGIVKDGYTENYDDDLIVKSNNAVKVTNKLPNWSSKSKSPLLNFHLNNNSNSNSNSNSNNNSNNNNSNSNNNNNNSNNSSSSSSSNGKNNKNCTKVLQRVNGQFAANSEQYRCSIGSATAGTAVVNNRRYSYNANTSGKKKNAAVDGCYERRSDSNSTAVIPIIKIEKLSNNEYEVDAASKVGYDREESVMNSIKVETDNSNKLLRQVSVKMKSPLNSAGGRENHDNVAAVTTALGATDSNDVVMVANDNNEQRRSPIMIKDEQSEGFKNVMNRISSLTAKPFAINIQLDNKWKQFGTSPPALKCNFEKKPCKDFGLKF